MHSVTEIGGQTEPQWNGRMILMNGWCSAVVFSVKLYLSTENVGQQSTSVFIYVLSSRLLGLFNLTKVGLVLLILLILLEKKNNLDLLQK